MSVAGEIADEAADLATDEYGQRLDALELAVRLMERWPPITKKHATGFDLLHGQRAFQATEVAEIFCTYLAVRDPEGDKE